MKTLLTLLLLIPSLSWGETIWEKIPETKVQISKLFNIEIGYKVEHDGSSEFWTSKYNEFWDSKEFTEKNPYILINGSDIPSFILPEIKKSEAAELLFDSGFVIKGVSNDYRFKESGKIGDLNILEATQYRENYIPYGKCYDKLIKSKKAISLKLNIKESFLDYYQYFPDAKIDETVLMFGSIIKSKVSNTVLRLNCAYDFDEDKRSDLYIVLFDADAFQFQSNFLNEMMPEMISKNSLIDKKVFKELFDMFILDYNGNDFFNLIKGL